MQDLRQVTTGWIDLGYAFACWASVVGSIVDLDQQKVLQKKMGECLRSTLLCDFTVQASSQVKIELYSQWGSIVLEALV